VRRFLDPAILAFAIALVASLGIHLPAYQVLGVLADRLFEESARRAEGPTQIEFELPAEEAEEGVPDEAAVAPEDSKAPDEAEPERAPEPERKAEQRPPPKPEEKKPAPEKKEDKKEEPKLAEQQKEQAEPQPKKVEQASQHAVKQHSSDPSVPPPDDARFIAEESNRVEEETVAEIRNDVRDDVDPNAGPSEATAESPEVGNADETEVAHLREMEGSDARAPTPEEAEEDRPDKVAKVDPSRVPPGSTQRGEDGAAADPGARGPAGDARTARTAQSARAAERAGPEGAEDTMVIHDGFGSLRVAVPRRGQSEVEGDEGSGARSREARRARAARSGRQGGGDGRYDGIPGTNRRFAWSELQDAYGRDQLEDEREAYLAERQSKKKGGQRQKEWGEFRAAVENFVPNVKPGNQTALNAAASPFAAYISDVHRRIHREYADKFLAGLPTWSGNPMADPSLLTKLEIIFNRDGTLHRVGVIKTSGFLPFDYGAWRAVMRGQPYPEPPLAILSGDGRVYMHWGFYRNHRQCGTFNAEPYILPNPPGTPEDTGGPLQDKPEWGGVVPKGSKPTWGTEREGKGGDGGGERPSEDAPKQQSPPSEGDGEGGGDGGDGKPRHRPDGDTPPRRVRPGGAALG
jgi:hypothetical protein